MVLRFVRLTIVLYVLIAAAVFAIDKVGQSRYEGRVDELLMSSQYVAATVTSLGDHNSVCYQYAVDGTTYKDCSGNDYDAGTPVVGRTVTVFYDPRHPGVSCSCNPPDEAFSLKWGPVWFASVAALLLAPVGSWWFYFGGPKPELPTGPT